ncbi:unnamed protein product [Effrenium voratum]|nr:unnamed protein product [Effrenium voratum]
MAARRASGFLLLLALVFLRAVTFVSPAPSARAQRSVAVFLQATATDDTASKVADVIAEQLGVEAGKVTREATLTELGADSLDIVESVHLDQDSIVIAVDGPGGGLRRRAA